MLPVVCHETAGFFGFFWPKGRNLPPPVADAGRWKPSEPQSAGRIAACATMANCGSCPLCIPQPKEGCCPPSESTPKAKRNVPANYAHSVLLLLKSDSESVLLLCHFSDCLASISRPADY